jgi:hypothetical protein
MGAPAAGALSFPVYQAAQGVVPLPFPPRPPFRRSNPRVLRPRMLRVPTLQLLPDLRKRVLPEAQQVVGDLLRALVLGPQARLLGTSDVVWHFNVCYM